jgi:hypothetical protein
VSAYSGRTRNFAVMKIKVALLLVVASEPMRPPCEDAKPARSSAPCPR